MAKQIPETQALQARALFLMAQTRYRECKQFEEQLSALLGYPADDPYMGCLSDEIYDDHGSFDKGLRNEGFTVKPKPAKARR